MWIKIRKGLSIIILLSFLIAMTPSISVLADETLTNNQILEMAERVSLFIDRYGIIPLRVYIDQDQTNYLSAAEYCYIVSNWIKYYKSNNTPPTTVSVKRNIDGPTSPSGVDVYTVSQGDILAKGEGVANYIDSNNRLPNYGTLSNGTQLSIKALFYCFTKTLVYYKNNGSLPTSVNTKAVQLPKSWKGELNQIPSLEPSEQIWNKVISVPYMFSTEGATSGATSLDALMAYHGEEVRIREIINNMTQVAGSAYDDDITPETIVSSAVYFGFEKSSIKSGWEELKSCVAMDIPVIVQLAVYGQAYPTDPSNSPLYNYYVGEEYVVVCGLKADQQRNVEYVIAHDPAVNAYLKISYTSFDTAWSNYGRKLIVLTPRQVERVLVNAPDAISVRDFAYKSDNIEVILTDVYSNEVEVTNATVFVGIYKENNSPLAAEDIDFKGVTRNQSEPNKATGVIENSSKIVFGFTYKEPTSLRMEISVLVDNRLITAQPKIIRIEGILLHLGAVYEKVYENRLLVESGKLTRVTISIYDNNGNLTPVPNDLEIVMASDRTSIKFYLSTSMENPISKIIIPKNCPSADVYVYDEITGGEGNGKVFKITFDGGQSNLRQEIEGVTLDLIPPSLTVNKIFLDPNLKGFVFDAYTPDQDIYAITVTLEVYNESGWQEKDKWQWLNLFDEKSVQEQLYLVADDSKVLIGRDRVRFRIETIDKANNLTTCYYKNEEGCPITPKMSITAQSNGWVPFTIKVSPPPGTRLIGDIFKEEDVEIAYGFDSSNQKWIQIDRNNNYIQPLDGFMIRLKSGFVVISLPVSGEENSLPSKTLRKGFNLVGSWATAPAKDVLYSLGAKWEYITKPFSGADEFDAFITSVEDEEFLKNQNVYWIYMTEDGIYTSGKMTPVTIEDYLR